MYKVYKIIFKFIAFVYIYMIMPFLDAIANGVMYVIARNTVHPELVKAFQNIIDSPAPAHVKFQSVHDLYKYKHDPLNGLINYNWRSIWVAALCNFHGDCDKFAYLMSKVLPGGKKYSILPYSSKHWDRMHVVYVYKNTVFSSGWWHKCSFEQYMDLTYTKNGIDCYVVKFW